ncbi:hypothetical protein [Gelidibacter japonicus]|uniref:hypothetical protein n=1 Tax=Gelidibacter japonicus TaxID=1962232 RepID=UPI003A8F7C9E|tara:strand:+ start:15690 stop:16829 length:1140 start_codon:yes stop_codon:yes gene_type:complete
MKLLIKQIYDQISKYGLVVIFVLYLLLEIIAKYFHFSKETTNIPMLVKGIILCLVIGLIATRIHKIKNLWLLLVLPVIFVIGQLTINDSFSENSLVIFGKFIAPILFYIIFSEARLNPNYRKITFQIFEWGMLVNSCLLLIGFLFDFNLFESYRGNRFGYSGIFLSPGVASYAYLVTLFYFIIAFKEKVWKNWKFIFIFSSCLFIGTKAIYLGQIILVLYTLTLVKTKYKKLFIALLGIIGAVAAYLFFFKFGLFNKVRETNGLLSAILSFRDRLLLDNTIPYIQENWSFINYLFGGVSNFDLRSQMEVIDIFFFWGILGGVIYLLAYVKHLITFKMNSMLWVFAGLLILIVFLAGNFFVYSTITIFLLMLRERISQLP